MRWRYEEKRERDRKRGQDNKREGAWTRGAVLNRRRAREEINNKSTYGTIKAICTRYFMVIADSSNICSVRSAMSGDLMLPRGLESNGSTGPQFDTERGARDPRTELLYGSLSLSTPPSLLSLSLHLSQDIIG